MTKRHNETYFEVNRNINAKCWSENTRYGFRHMAELMIKFETIETDKACYYNRTWERYTFESVLKGLYDKAKKNQSLSISQLRQFKKVIDNGGKREMERVSRELKTVATVAKMGEFLAGDSKKAKNDWKARVLKAGLENKGLIMPEDWETLSEDEKERRLNNVINELGK